MTDKPIPQGAMDAIIAIAEADADITMINSPNCTSEEQVAVMDSLARIIAAHTADPAEVDRARHQGLIDGIGRFAWWKDGVQYVGTCGTTLKTAIADAEKETT